MWVEHLPTFGKNGKASVQFSITGTGTQYTDLAQTYLSMKVAIVQGPAACAWSDYFNISSLVSFQS